MTDRPAQPYFAQQAADLEALSSRGRRRALAVRAGRDFSSNDYLALAEDPRLRAALGAAIDEGVPAGSGGSRLLRGNHSEHEALEADAARQFGCEAALFFGSGFAANMALLGTLPQRGDRIFHDDLVHASAHDGMRLSRAPAESFAHNDANALEQAISTWRAAGGTGRSWIVAETLYSMDGDRAPLEEFAAVADRHEAILLLDEAHATGVFGPGGRGLAAALAGRENAIFLHTCGKALGCEGALVSGPAVVTDFLVNRARPFIFSTAPSPLMARAVRESLRIVADEDEPRERLTDLCAEARRLLVPLGAVRTSSQIIPLLLGDDVRTMRAAGELQRRGFDVRGIRPPTVPAGTARLRISITLNSSADDIGELAEALADVLQAGPA
ncbi:8-amino-7-oxononanoate synthase [Pacificimonas flava]|uniref:8-amino-7-oxononanoate synthase n=2 Tax=Pacificimonas TaxID=1960290 RepID=A0A219B4J8_9SPHN|nr:MULTISPECIES: 8-amino-7-oxononanoate synthase [Pacificimonas]MBZ6377249.1 8-amino-7-oxononanoate synthase [Pacificimonas aurantium]OWV33036.1 8-amino-7-oxononanoate synthase [Pacificimonas flava]